MRILKFEKNNIEFALAFIIFSLFLPSRITLLQSIVFHREVYFQYDYSFEVSFCCHLRFRISYLQDAYFSILNVSAVIQVFYPSFDLAVLFISIRLERYEPRSGRYFVRKTGLIWPPFLMKSLSLNI